jgi:pimeloyl-ACP methyl ester carboxylesterase
VAARPVPAVPPAGIADLIQRVASCYPAAGVPPGSVRVEGIRGADGRRSWIVEIPGTQEWSPVPGRNPADLTADVAALGRASTAAAATVVRALELAGVRPSEPVLLAGHSLGGMLAAALAADPAFTRRFRVTHVVAAGSPLAGYAVRPGVAVLALEHDDDLVPALDGAPDPDRPDWVTVRRSSFRGRSPAAAHDSAAYAETAGLVDTSSDPSLRAWRAGLAPFLARPGARATGLLVVGRRSR